MSTAVDPRKLVKIREILSVGSPVAVEAAGVARVLGPPVRVHVVEQLLKRGVSPARPEQIARLAAQAQIICAEDL